MSFWHAPLFGTGHKAPPRPASAAAIRCTRIRHTRGIPAAQSVIVGMALGKPLAFGTLILGFMSIQSASLARAAGPGGGGSLQAQIATFLREGRGHWVEVLIALTVVSLFVMAFPSLARWVFERNAHRITVESQQRMRRMRRRGRGIAIGFAAAIVLLAVATGILTDWSLVLLMISTYTIVAGVMVIALGFVARRGKHLTCARCDYPMGSFRDATDRCAECGSEWRKPWHHTVGERRISWRWICVGLAAIVVGWALQATALMQLI